MKGKKHTWYVLDYIKSRGRMHLVDEETGEILRFKTASQARKWRARMGWNKSEVVIAKETREVLEIQADGAVISRETREYLDE